MEAEYAGCDAVRWETSAEETTADGARNKEEAAVSNTSDDVKNGVFESRHPTFMISFAHLKISRREVNHIMKGDIMRGIN